MTEKRRSIAFLNANTLRFLALAFMLTDHVWGTLVSGQLWMTCVGRMAFPIFAFQVSEGFVHTHDIKKYAQRLFVFALISEIPFDLMLNGRYFYPFDQNIMFTLLLGLWAITVLDRAKKNPATKNLLIAAAKVLGIWLFSMLLMVDYGILGVPTVLLFYVFRDFKGAKIGQLVSMVLLHVVVSEGQTLPLMLGSWKYEFPVQGFAVFALIFIWLYNGEKGKTSKILQYAAYWFYPVHMLILYLIVFFG